LRGAVKAREGRAASLPLGVHSVPGGQPPAEEGHRDAPEACVTTLVGVRTIVIVQNSRSVFGMADNEHAIYAEVKPVRITKTSRSLKEEVRPTESEVE
jgi:hypothetical protein